MATTIIADFQLKVSFDDFVDNFWYDGNWYEKFLIEKLNNLNVTVEKWTTTTNNPTNNNNSFSVKSFFRQFFNFVSFLEFLLVEEFYLQ